MAPAVVVHLPYELLIEILSSLPVKTLIRFKCVCKSWKSLIFDDKAFVKLQLERTSLENKHVIFISQKLRTYELMKKKSRTSKCYITLCPVPRLLEEPSSIMEQDRCLSVKDFVYDKIIGSCNGLVCLQLIGFRFRLWNPATRLRFDTSPPLPLIGYGFNQTHWFGFGYDVSCDTYKVVVVLFLYRGDRLCEIVTMVYCIGDSCWREILSVPDIPIKFRQSYGPFVGGCVNWLAHNFERLVIVSLDMHEETYRLLSLPEGTSESEGTGAEIQVLGNSLCLFYDHKGTHFVAWKMREYGVSESWTRLVCISYEHLQCDHRFQLHQWLICLLGDGDIFMLAKNGELVITYNLSDNSVEHVELPGNKLWFGASDYVESLVSPR